MCSSLTPRPTLTFSTRRLGLFVMRHWESFLIWVSFAPRRRKRSGCRTFATKFENLRLNRRVDANMEFISDADWMQCASPLDMKALAGKPCYAGLDLSTTTDMSALCLYWPHDGSVLPFFWLPAEGLLDRDRKEGSHYRTWRDAGLLETTPGKAINFKFIIRRLAEISTEYRLKAVAYDRAFIKTFNAQCEELGVKLPLEEFGQGYVRMSSRGAST